MPRAKRDIFSVQENAAGFTLIELLVVIGIIALLSTMTWAAVNAARGKARIARAQGDVKQLSTAIVLLSADTGKWPNGCPVENTADPEADLASQQAGITMAPVVGTQSTTPVNCSWTASDIAKWNGPYMKAAIDPWGNPYYFDPDYQRPSCPSGTLDLNTVPNVMSGGPNKSALNVYDCDNITYELR